MDAQCPTHFSCSLELAFVTARLNAETINSFPFY